MLTSYTGQIREGKPVLSDTVVLPENSNFVITILDGFVFNKTRTKAERQNEALKKLSAGLKAIEDEPLDESFDDLIKQRVNISRELDI